MKQKNLPAFTLIELIVVVTILGILATIGYLSILWYAQNARNSSRVSDIRTIQKALGLFITQNSQYPLPDNQEIISFSGATAWTQGIFWIGTLRQLERISNVPQDPIFWAPYSYSVSADRTRYQLGSVVEGEISWIIPGVPQSYAISSDNLYSYIIGDFITEDIKISLGNECKLITSPSILLSDIPAWWSLSNGWTYNYSYTNSSHIPQSYSGSIELNTPSSGFQILSVLDSCEINTLWELVLYIAKLSTAYQQLATLWKYENLIYNSNTLAFKLQTIASLEINNITVADAVIQELNSPLPEIVFVDTFDDTNGVLIGSHSPNTPLASWSLIAGWNAGAYSISGNTLVKNDSSNSLIYPTVFPTMSSADYNVAFDIENFWGGDISIYLRYTDANNYYKIDISAAWYLITRRLAGVDVILQNINDPISIGSTVLFDINSNTLTFLVNGVEKESIVGSGINSIGLPLIVLQNSGASVDNYTFTYK